jgi:hypothetical protein
MMSGKNVKGQFFIIGAILICALFFVSLPLAGPAARQAAVGDLEQLSLGLGNEFGRALNLGIEEGRPIACLKDFTTFTDSVLLDRFSSFQAFWVVSEPSGTGIKVTSGNFLGSEAAVTLNISGDARNLDIPDSGNMTESFSPLPKSFSLDVSFPGGARTLEWARDKTSIYVYYRMDRQGNSVAREYSG